MTRACTILLVDDEPANLDLLEALLESGGYGAAGGGRLLRTEDPREVAALVETYAPDLVLLDLHMPHRHGLEVLADLSASIAPHDYRPVLVLTADVTSDAKEQALRRGARDFVTKPFDTVEVLLRVKNLLDARVLHVAERESRERAEQAEARASLLAEWSRRLAAILDPSAAAAQLVPLLVPQWAVACEVRLGDVVIGSAASESLAPRLSADVSTSADVIGQLLLAGAGSGSCVADQSLVDELALRLGMAAEHARLLAAAHLAVTERERLLGVVAHDLRNPLGAVAMYAEMIASLQTDDETQDGPTQRYVRGALATIFSSTRIMQRLIEDLLDASTLRGDALRVVRAPVVAGELFAEVEQMLRPIAEQAGVLFDVRGEEEVTERIVSVDAARVSQLLSNLVGNAVAHTRPGGRVSVRYGIVQEREEEREQLREQRREQERETLRFTVADTGSGIAADDLPHLFTAFWRGDRRSRRGVGLGLWIARAIAEAHSGELSVVSAPGVGTTFTCVIPLTDAPVLRRED